MEKVKCNECGKKVAISQSLKDKPSGSICKSCFESKDPNATPKQKIINIMGNW